jgi:hypothetical protein
MAMADMYQEIDDGVDKKNKKDGQETSREACDVRTPSLVGWTNGEPVTASALLVTNKGPNNRVALTQLARSALCHT